MKFLEGKQFATKKLRAIDRLRRTGVQPDSGCICEWVVLVRRRSCYRSHFRSRFQSPMCDTIPSSVRVTSVGFARSTASVMSQLARDYSDRSSRTVAIVYLTSARRYVTFAKLCPVQRNRAGSFTGGRGNSHKVVEKRGRGRTRARIEIAIPIIIYIYFPARGWKI